MILIVLNYEQCRLTSSIQYMLKFLCNVFPTNFSHHVGIVFTHFNLNNVLEEEDDQRENYTNKFVPKIMKIISETTREPLFIAPPVFFLNSKNNRPLEQKDEHTKGEIERIIANAKMKNPIQNINDEASYDNPYQSNSRNNNNFRNSKNSDNSRNDLNDLAPFLNLTKGLLEIIKKSNDNSSGNLINRNSSNYPPYPPSPPLLNNVRRNQFNSPGFSSYSQVPNFGPVHGPIFGPISPPF